MLNSLNKSARIKSSVKLRKQLELKTDLQNDDKEQNEGND